MFAEILTVGSELTRGDIADTNAAFLAQELFARGYEICRTVSVPDETGLIVQAFREAAAQSDVVIVTGGLGPTADDLTAACAAEAMGVGLVENQEALAAIEGYFQKLGREMSPNNRKQAQVPEGARVVVSPVGTAPAFSFEIGKCLFWCTAGVPREMKYLFSKVIVPDLAERRPAGTFVRARSLRCFWLAESRLDQMVRGLFADLPTLEVGFKTEWPENVLLLFARGASEQEAESVLLEAERRAREVLGDLVVAQDSESFVGNVMSRLEEETIAVVEVGSEGYVTRLVAESRQEGLLCSWVCRSEESARCMLAGAQVESFLQEESVRELARTARKVSGATYGLAVGGLAEPVVKERGSLWNFYVAMVGEGVEECRLLQVSGDLEQRRRRAAFDLFSLVDDSLTCYRVRPSDPMRGLVVDALHRPS